MSNLRMLLLTVECAGLLSHMCFFLQVKLSKWPHYLTTTNKKCRHIKKHVAHRNKQEQTFSKCAQDT